MSELPEIANNEGQGSMPDTGMPMNNSTSGLNAEAPR